MQLAARSDKACVSVGRGADVDADMFHNLAAEPGHGKVLEREGAPSRGPWPGCLSVPFFRSPQLPGLEPEPV